ncbi:hypothetical protein Pmani_025576 [Petrolisthes manimaculis]|uniref:Uncharacterized protein n=1 Tax=Petrolisthes manimaculis TaxID=1843537 RepID=A0AAE1P6Y6_9EUCA|nr:hypothetical protein Pmani_025576 [Petrolisthes manimaculis]
MGRKGMQAEGEVGSVLWLVCTEGDGGMAEGEGLSASTRGGGGLGERSPSNSISVHPSMVIRLAWPVSGGMRRRALLLSFNGGS